MFVSAAYAQTAGGAGGLAGGLGGILPIILIFGIMYFLMIRPQQKKAKAHKAMIAALRRGDQVLTQGGIIGKVTKVKDDANEVEIEIATDVKIRVMRHTITSVMNKTEPSE
ncbi:MAG: preprotein translocase subunit YajC [Rhodobacteraceae bacterium]|nr:preprotein translocase subunit YajC [Paracoccaceae bacterium]